MQTGGNFLWWLPPPVATPVALQQSADAGNSTAHTNTAAQYVGTWMATRAAGIVRQLVVLASNVASGLGGTFVFEYGEDGSTATISESRTIVNFATVRDFDLINAGAYFRVKFTPSRTLTVSEFVYINTTQRRQNDGQFVRLANQQIEEGNAAMGSTFSYGKAFVRQTGQSINIRANKGEALLVAPFDTEVALGYITGYASGTAFGRVTGTDAADNAVDVWAFADDAAVARADTKTFPTSAATLYVTSSSASDTAVEVTLEYITSTGAAANVTVTTNGMTPVSTGVTGLDVNVLRVSGATGSVGVLYASQGNAFVAGVPTDVTKILATAPAGFNRAQSAQFTVPLGKTLIIREGLVTISRASGSAGSADVTLRIKEYGKAQQVRRQWFPSTNVPIQLPSTHIVVPARAQIVWRVDDVSDTDTQTSVVWIYDLIDD